VERDALKDALPMRCDAAWFRATFLEASCPAHLSEADDIWPYVKVNPDPDPDPDPRP